MSNRAPKEIKISESKYGVSVLDSSVFQADLSNINTSKECLVVYRENDGYYGSLAEVNGKFKCINNKIFQDSSSIILNK